MAMDRNNEPSADFNGNLDILFDFYAKLLESQKLVDREKKGGIDAKNERVDSAFKADFKKYSPITRKI